MPNGGHICCVSCTYSRLKPGKCDIWGVEISGLLLCRAFRFPGQSHTAARKDFKMLNKLKPGFVYAIDNSVVAVGNPEPVFQIMEIGSEAPRPQGGASKKPVEGDCIPLAPAPHSSPSTGRGILRKGIHK